MNTLSQLDQFIQNYLNVKITKLYKGAGYEDDRYSYQKKSIHFGLHPRDKVLDIGSGNNPFPLATHLADLHEGETTHRSEKLIKDGRPFTVCDIANLPFKDKEFDFIYCSHVLEHAIDPAQACDELMRVGKRGYIETPTKTSDIMFNFLNIKHHHKWFVVMAGNNLCFFEYNPAEKRDTGTNDFYAMFHSEYQNPFQDLVLKNRKLFNNMLLWKDRFNYFIFDKTGRLIKTNTRSEE